MNDENEPVQRGKCYRFSAKNPAEAAQIIRERLGASARVLSVRSVEPSGLKRLWQSSRLEVLANIDEPEAPEEIPTPRSDEPVPPPTRSAELPGPRGRSLPPAQTLSTVLLRCGLSEVALGRLQSSPFWPELTEAPLHRALAEVGRHLQQKAASRRAPRLSRAAFLGTPGVGRTTALCKWLGVETTRHHRRGHVIAAEFDRPNSTGALPVFCEALGVPLAHYPASTQPAVPGGFVYFDLPGISIRSPAANAGIAEFLAREAITERVLVLNAAYDAASLRSAYAAGRDLGATHLIFTHLDEVPQWGRLWDYLFDAALEPVFFATGPSLTGDCEPDVFGALVRRTLADDAARGIAQSPSDESAAAAPMASTLTAP